MYKYIVQQEDINMLRQSVKTVYCRVELLNHNMQIVESLDGNLYNDNFSCTGESIVRRTLSFDMVVSDSTYAVGKDKKIWIDKYIRVYYGIEVQRTKEIKYYLIGTFSFVDMNTSYSATTKSISVTCSDRMADFDGTKGGVMTYNTEAAVTFKITAGQKYQEVLVGLITSAGITNYEISGVDGYTIPYDIEWEVGSTYASAWTQLRDLYEIWEFFFDEEGSFIWRKIPTGLGEDVVLDDDVMKELVISESLSGSFSNVYNATEIWGMELDLVDDDMYASTCTGGTSTTDTVFHITLEGITAMEDIDNFTNIGIKVSGAYGKYININNIQDIPILDSKGTGIAVNSYTPDTVYVFRYRRTATGDITEVPYLNFYLLGQYQAKGYYEETSTSVPYSVPNVGYVIPKVIERTDLWNDEVCYSQARYETYKTTAKQDTLSLQMIAVPFLEPSQKIKYTVEQTDDRDEWIVKSFSWSMMSGVMSVQLYRFLQGYSYVSQS